MKKYKIKYNADGNIMLTEVEATNLEDAMMIFYMSNPHYDILNIEEI